MPTRPARARIRPALMAMLAVASSGVVALACGGEGAAGTTSDGGADDAAADLVDEAGDATDADAADASADTDASDDAPDDDADAEADADTSAPDADVDTTDGGPDADAAGADADAGPAGPWRSVLYPDDWTPGFATDDGHFLHDFSYAGYRRGEAPLPTWDDRYVVNVEVDTTGTTDATDAIQAAIEDVVAAGGGRVQLPMGLIRVDGQLFVDGDNVVITGVDAPSTGLWFTSTAIGNGGAHLNVGPWQRDGGTARLLPLEGDPIPVTAETATWDRWIPLETTEGLAVGDLVTVGWTITPEFVADHGMTGVWTVFVEQRAAFFRREIVDVDAEGRRIRVDIPLRAPMQLRDRPTVAPLRHVVREVGIENLSITTSTDEATAWAHDRQAAIELVGVVDGWVRNVRSFAHHDTEPDPDGVMPHLRSGGIRVSRSSRVTIADTHLAHPQNRGGGGNGYLFEILQSGEVLTVDSTADRGRHNFIQNWGFGTSGCVWLRVRSTGGAAATGGPGSFESPGLSEFHHSLATANLIDDAHIDDGWGAVNRLTWSSGAGHTATENVMWAPAGSGVIHWFNFGRGYVVGTDPRLDVFTALPWFGGDGTAPEDWTEGLGRGADLEPASLYEDQLARRLARDAP